MKKSTNYLPVLLLFVLFGCGDDELDRFPLTNKTEGTYYKDESQLDQALNDIYRQLGRHYDAQGLPDIYGELYSDNTDILHIADADGAILEIDEYRMPANNVRVQDAWDDAYNGIYICNNILHQLENTTVEIDGSKLEAMKGQAVLIRSLIYFNLVRAFGPIPYIDKKIEPLESYEYLRVEPSVIYENLIGDLNYAKSVLPVWTGADVGRVGKYGAAAILAKMYLTIGDSEKAKTELEFIIDSNLFSLDANRDGKVDVGDLRHLFHPDTRNSGSSILEAQYMGGENAMNSGHQRSYSPFFYSFYLPGDNRLDYRGNGHNTPSDGLINAFEEDDPRKEIFLRTGYTDVGSGEFIYFPFTMKFFDPNWDNPGQNVEIIRYADILLMYSEVTQDPQYLNMVRSRAGVPLFGTAGYSSDKYPTLSLAIEHERRMELCFEFHRLFDLVRTGRAMEVIQGINGTDLLFPIPQYAIDVNPRMTQNQGYN